MKIITAGGRDFNDYETFKQCMKTALIRLGIPEGNFRKYFYGPRITVYQGEASGADALGKRWAEENSLDIKSFPPDWKLFGKKAGPIRNSEMAAKADVLVAIWDGQSKGTFDIIKKCVSGNVTVIVFNYSGELIKLIYRA